MLGLGRTRSYLRLGWLRAALLAGSLGLAACNTTPTLPLPPPSALASAPDEQGFALVRGEARSQAYVSVLNDRTDEGVITRANERGQFQVRIQAQIGDDLTVWQQSDGETSEPFYVTVQPTR